VDFYGYTALHAAAENGHVEMIPLLLGNLLFLSYLRYIYYLFISLKRLINTEIVHKSAQYYIFVKYKDGNGSGDFIIGSEVPMVGPSSLPPPPPTRK
jgi:ankyrin repeat protein